MLKLNGDYSDYYDDTDANYPLGKAVDASASDSYDGTPLLADFMNDFNGAAIAMYKKAYGTTSGITGSPDTQLSSQLADAIAKYSDDNLEEHGALRGTNAHGATVAATAGQLMTRDSSGRSKIADPVDDDDVSSKGYVDDTADTVTANLTTAINLAAPQGGVASVDGAAITVTVPNFTAESLYAGACVKILCPKVTTANPTLNVNGTGAYAIKCVRNGSLIDPVVHTGYWGGASAATARVWDNNTTLELIFNGSYWVVMGNPVFNSYFSADKGYTVYSNGKLECSGFVDFGSNLLELQGRATFPVNFTSASYVFTVNAVRAGTSKDCCMTYGGYNGHNSYVDYSIFGRDNDFARYVCWLAVGY